MTLAGSTMKKKVIRPSAPAWKPHGIQKRGVKFLVEHAAAALLFDPGLGKTSTTLAAFTFLKKRKVANRMLIIAPLRVCHLVWPAEVQKWADFNHLRVGVLHGKAKEQVLENVEDYDVLVINPEGLEWLIMGGKGKAFNRARWRKLGIDTLCIDELTKFKHAKGARFKMLKQVLETFARRWGLTGTPVPNGLLDLFGQMYVLDMGNALGRYITHYRMEYFRSLDPMGWKWVLQKGAEARIYERIKPLAIRANAEDYLDLPEIMPTKFMMELPPAVRQLYDALEEDMFAKMDDKVITAANAAAINMKLRQICNGALYVDDDVAALVRGAKRSIQELHEVKLDAVAEMLEELQGQPLFLAYEFKHDLYRLLKRFPNTPVLGSKDIKHDKELEAAWNRNEYPLMLGQPAGTAHGLNLQEGGAMHVGWFSMFWDLELYDQFFRRVRRQGNKAKRVFNHHFMMRDTTDEVVWYAQRGKERGQNALLAALEDRRKARK